jgi:N-acetylglucosaminyl-diphospho-decaprenol L-rhamnosyltransferase
MSTTDVVVVAYQSRDRIAGCLSPLRDLSGLGSIIVVDHGADGAGRVAEELGATVIEQPSNPGFGAGQNAGLRLCRGDYVLICNPDAVVIPDAIAIGIDHLDHAPRVAAVQGHIFDAHTSGVQRSAWLKVGPVFLWSRVLGISRIRRMIERITSATPGPLSSRPCRPSGATAVTSSPVEALGAVALLCRRAALDAVGGFDEGYFLYREDIDLCRRLRARQWELRTLDLPWAAHEGGASSSDPRERDHQWWKGTMRYAALWFTPREWAAATCAAIVHSAFQITLGPATVARDIRDLIVEPVQLRRQRSRGSTRGTP